MATTDPRRANPQEWEQTLVADASKPAPPEPPAAAPEPTPAPAPEPAPEPAETAPPLEPIAPVEPPPLEALPDQPLEALPPPEPLPEASPEAEPAEAEELPVPADLKAYVRRDGSALVLREPYLTRERRERLEREAAPTKGAKLMERRWIPGLRVPIHEVEMAVDVLEARPRYEPKAVQWIQRTGAETRRALRGLERVPANIVGKRVVYETEGGFVVEVTYRELGQTRRKYFTVPAESSRSAALRALRSGSYAQATAVSDDLIDAVARPRVRGRPTVAPGKVHTWPIRNRVTVDALGLKPAQRRALAKLGIRTTDQLRVRGPVVLARHTGASPDETRRWQYAAELLLVQGVGPALSRALADAGVRGIDDLRRRSATSVLEALAPVVAARRRKLPGLGRARAGAWIRAAKRLRKTRQDFPA